MDSDLEWEEEGEGESLNGSDDEKERDADDEEYEVDNDFFVPHGHLSDEEMELEDDENNSPEAQKAKLKVLQLEFAEEMKKKTEKIKPRLIGCIWISNNETEPESCSPLIWTMLQTRAMLHDGPISLNWDDPAEDAFATGITATPSIRRAKIKDEDMPELIRLVHRNLHSRKFLIEEFAAHRKKLEGDEYRELVNLGAKIKEIAEYRQFTEEGFEKYSGWVVKADILDKFQVVDLPTLNGWSYTLQPKRFVSSEKTSSPSSRKTSQMDEDTAKELIRLLHGNVNSRKFLVHEFTAFRKAKYGERENFQEIKFIGSKIKKFADWKQFTDAPLQGKLGWCVKEAVLEQYKMTDISVENTWKYTLPLPIKKRAAAPEMPTETPKVAAPSEKPPQSKAQPGAGSIQKFAKKLTDVEKRDQFKKVVNPASAAASPAAPKKRVQLLMSVPCGETIPEAKKNTLISQFLSKNIAPKVEKATPMEVDDDDGVIVLE